MYYSIVVCRFDKFYISMLTIHINLSLHMMLTKRNYNGHEVSAGEPTC
jgi:hypothetical protein